MEQKSIVEDKIESRSNMILDLVENNISNIEFLINTQKEHLKDHIERNRQDIFALIFLCIMLSVMIWLDAHEASNRNKLEEKVTCLEDRILLLEKRIQTLEKNK